MKSWCAAAAKVRWAVTDFLSKASSLCFCSMRLYRLRSGIGCWQLLHCGGSSKSVLKGLRLMASPAGHKDTCKPVADA